MKTLIAALFVSQLSIAADVPGGLMRTAAHLPANSYEIMFSPTVLFTGGAYLNSELRYQPYEEFGTGFSFGAGEPGFNIGAQGVWHALALESILIPKFAVLGGVYMNRIAAQNYFVLKAAPTLSHTFELEWGDVTPYAGLALSPSFNLTNPANLFSVKGTLGAQMAVKGWDGLRVHLETNWGLANSGHEIAIGIAYPFSTTATAAAGT